MTLTAIANGQQTDQLHINQLINLLTGIMNDQPVTLKADNTHPVILKLDTVNASQAVVVDYLDAGVLKWEMGKGTANAFGLWDNVRGNYVLSAVSNGDLTLMAGGGKIITGAGLVGINRTPTTYQLEVGGDVWTSGALRLSTAVGKLIPGATSFSHRNSADSADNVLIKDAGSVEVRSWMALGGVAPFTPTLGDLIVNRGGASPGSGAIFFGSSGGSHYIYYDGTKFLFTDNLNVTTSVTAGAGAASDATTYQAFIDSSAGAAARTAHQTTLSIAGTATAIINQDNLGYRAMLVFIHGTDGTNQFADLVIWTTGTVTTITSVTDAGTPAARTYTTNANGQLKLAMASGTYRTNAFAVAVLNPR